MKYVPRRAATALRRLLRTFPAVLVFGPRQSGKSTLVRRLFPGWLHLDLERPRDLALVSADPDAFFTAHQYTIRSLRQAMADLGCQKGWIVTGAGERRRAGTDLEIVPWGQVAAGEIDFGLGRSRRIRPA